MRAFLKTAARSSSMRWISGSATTSCSNGAETKTPSRNRLSRCRSITSRLSSVSITRSVLARSSRSSYSTQQWPSSSASSTQKWRPGPNPGWQILGRPHLPRDFVDTLEAETDNLPDEHVRIALQDRNGLAAELAHQRGDLMMRQPESRQVSHRGIEIAVRDPDALQVECDLYRHLCGGRHRLRAGPDRCIEAAPELHRRSNAPSPARSLSRPDGWPGSSPGRPGPSPGHGP